MKKVILIGGCPEIFELCMDCEVEIAGVVDHSDQVLHGCNLPYLGTDEVFLSNKEKYLNIPLVVIPESPSIRKRIVEKYRIEGFLFSALISPKADISRSAQLAEGSVIFQYVTITAEAKIGAFARVCHGSRIFHECCIGDFVTIAPGATLLGRVQVEELSYIGTNSTIVPERKVGKECKIGAGSVVIRNVPSGRTVFGVPALPVEV